MVSRTPSPNAFFGDARTFRINPTHLLAPFVVDFVFPGQRWDAVNKIAWTGGNGTTIGSPTTTAYYSSSTGGGVSAPIIARHQIQSGTVLWFGRIGTLNSDYLLSGVTAGGANADPYYRWGLYHVTGNFRVDFVNGYTGVFQNTPTGIVDADINNDYCLIGVNFQSGGIRTYLNGAVKSVGTAIGTGAINYSAADLRGCNDAGLTRAGIATTCWTIAFNQQLSDADHISIARNPYSLLQSRRPRMLKVPGAAPPTVRPLIRMVA
jgi:hypothetical protein